MRHILAVLGTAALFASFTQACSDDEPASSSGAAAQTEAGTSSSGGSSGTASGGVQVSCGTVDCKMGEICCVGIGGAQCIAGSQNCSGVSLKCNGQADCATGEICCATIAGFGGSAECKSTCTGSTSVQVCEADSECKNGKPCAPIPKSPFPNPKTCGTPGEDLLDSGLLDVNRPG